MPVKVMDIGFGEPIPPGGPHSITFNVSGWDNGIRFRAGDKAIFAQFKSIYPRFSPWNEVKQVGVKADDLAKKTHPD
jgi:hypothetical protein